MAKRLIAYRSYLLRLWRSSTDASSWRASLEEPQGGQIHGFATLDHLFDFLKDQTAVIAGDSSAPEADGTMDESDER